MQSGLASVGFQLIVERIRRGAVAGSEYQAGNLQVRKTLSRVGSDSDNAESLKRLGRGAEIRQTRPGDNSHALGQSS